MDVLLETGLSCVIVVKTSFKWIVLLALFVNVIDCWVEPSANTYPGPISDALIILVSPYWPSSDNVTPSKSWLRVSSWKCKSIWIAAGAIHTSVVCTWSSSYVTDSEPTLERIWLWSGSA